MLSKITITNNKGYDEILITEEGKTRKIKRDISGDFSSQRNFALGQAKGDWVLFIDSDETLSDEIKEIPDGYDAFFLRRLDIFWGKMLKHGETGKINLIRLARKNFGVWRGKVHEVWTGKGKLGYFKIYLIHRSHKNIREFITKINFYSEIRASETKSFNYLDLAKPIIKFIDNYFFKLGFIDGMPGFVMAYMMSFHSLLVRVKCYGLSKSL